MKPSIIYEPMTVERARTLTDIIQRDMDNGYLIIDKLCNYLVI